MNKAIRFTTTLVALGAAVASQAVTLSVDYVGKGANGGPTTTALGNFGDLSFDNSLTTPNAAAPTVITLYADAAQTKGLTITLGADTDPSALRYSGSATATGFGAGYSGYTGTNFSVVTNDLKSYVVSIQGDVQAVPEPASIAALGVGAVALLRRRKKA